MALKDFEIRPERNRANLSFGIISSKDDVTMGYLAATLSLYGVC